ncbi:MAG: GNAT family N-acetyltransferase [Rhodobacteraceae bacterium]|nr:GNAT family N-acetyltransferase [Paracoccaceae bacterium]
MQGDGDREAASRILIEPFDPARHERSGFSCGTERLDNFLRFSARKQQKDDFTRVFVAVVEGSPKILGYYALNAHAVATGELSADRPRRVPNTGIIPALYLSMIAVDRSWQGKGLGSDLAIDALGRALSVAGEVGLKLVVLDVIDDGENEAFARRMEFYLRLGFQSFHDRPERMFITVGTIRGMFGDR